MLFQKIGRISWKYLEKIERKNKNERNRSRWKNIFLYSPICRKRKSFGKVSFYISYAKRLNKCKNWFRRLFFQWKKASLAVETAFVLPIFFLGMLTMISFMDVYKEQTEHLVELCEKVKTAGMYAYVLNESGPEEVTLPDIYTYKPIGGLISLPNVWMYNQVTVHAWTGREGEVFFDDEEESEEMVYVTESGSVYHTDLGCTYLNLSVNQIPGSAIENSRNNYGEKYEACTCCSAGEDPAAMVYVTKTGNSYHNLETCSALKRTVRMVKHSCAEGLAACSRCG